MIAVCLSNLFLLSGFAEGEHPIQMHMTKKKGDKKDKEESN